ncbi:MAG: hypothetical protein ABF379_07655 [Akkermansiaceae bacterium]
MIKAIFLSLTSIFFSSASAAAIPAKNNKEGVQNAVNFFTKKNIHSNTPINA